MKSRKRKASSEKYLPPEVLTIVLARLPVKSLLKFRCVSKTWCSLIDNPDFISMHLELFKNNRDKTHLFVMEGMGYIGANGRKFSIRSTESLRKTLHLGKTLNKYWIVGSCNGLLLLKRDAELILWNPSVRKSMRLSPVVELKSATSYFEYVLGFAPLTNDYKVVAFEFDWKQPELLSMAVYILNDHQWRTRDVNGIDFPKNVLQARRGCLFFEGAVHWFTAGLKDLHVRNKRTQLASFDLDTETFSYLELPGSIEDIGTHWCLCLVGESLAVFSISYLDCSIWVMKKIGGKASWDLRFSGESTDDDVFFFKWYLQGQMFQVGKAGLCFTCEKRSYDFENHQMQLLAKSMNLPMSMQTYIESLVLCKGLPGQNWVSFP